jgi:adenylyl- and sulfurtransferase ThiI
MTKEEIIEMARQAGFERLGHDDCDLVCYPEEVEAFAKLIAEKEREECAVICETYWNRPNNGMSTEEEVYGSVTAELIRARGQE